MVAINSVITGASYSAGSFTIPISALNTELTTDWDTSEDNFEKLLYAMIRCLEKYETVNGLTDLRGSMTSTSVSLYPWNTATNNSTVRTYSVAFPFTDDITDADPDVLGANA